MKLPSLPHPGVYQITLSDEAWLDVVQDGKYARAIGSTGRRDCPQLRKSVRFELIAAPVILQFSGMTASTISFAITEQN